MTSGLHESTAPADDEVLEGLRARLEEQFDVYTRRLTELTMRGRLRDHGPDPASHVRQVEAARQGIADTAFALRRMSEGAYGRCVDCRRPIPLARLRALPHAARCGSCQATDRFTPSARAPRAS